MAYAIFLGYLDMGWKRSVFLRQNIRNTIPGNTEGGGVSVIIPCRNEADNIIACLDSIAINIAATEAEIIVVDDHSEDNTGTLVTGWIQSHKHITAKLIYAETQASGKKAALDAGISMAAFDAILTTDADCIHSPEWIKTMQADFDALQLVALCGPVQLQGESLFERMQIIESAGLVAMGAATLAMDMPTTSNGANLMFSRAAYHAAGGYESHKHIASGDDEFLVHALHRLYPGKVQFCHCSDAMVYTRAAGTFAEFIQQRVRWASKGRYYSNKGVNMLQLLLPLLLVSISCNAVLGYWQLLLLQLAVKTFADVYYFQQIKHFFNIERLKRYCWFLTLYQYYCLPVAVVSLAGRYTWKGRHTQ